MIQNQKLKDERREAGAIECWLLHGAVGLASDWRSISRELARKRIGSRAIDLWRFLDCCPMPIGEFGANLNAEAAGSSSTATTKVLIGYSMGGRLALHALLEQPHPWNAAIIISANPGLEDESERSARLARDATWASRTLLDPWESFLNDWNAQPVLAGAEIHSREARSRMAQRRKEIARSFIDWSVAAQSPLWSQLSRIQIPLLWLAGEDDQAAVEISKRISRDLPTIQTAIAPDCGHRIPWQNERWLVGKIANFLIDPNARVSASSTS